MPGTKIDGNAIAKDIREKLKDEITTLQASNPRFRPNLVIYQG
jgi:methylenetetrahydrofolate dehydrogenase (NADP+)/methenyltetrahydrofolate cyclohydrolase/formyltetrahydrofolate synthetase